MKHKSIEQFLRPTQAEKEPEAEEGPETPVNIQIVQVSHCINTLRAALVRLETKLYPVLQALSTKNEVEVDSPLGQPCPPMSPLTRDIREAGLSIDGLVVFVDSLIERLEI